MFVTDALHQAIYTALNGTITGGVYDQVPPGSSYPYTVIGEFTEQPDDLHDGEGSDVTCTLHIWSAAGSGSEVEGIMQEIDDALHHAALSVTGANCWAAVREFSQVLRDQNPDDGRPLRHGVVRHRFTMEEPDGD